mmetsp:Transcript_66790/g.184560  ORF Transcript_66790/g.184560 Transcript_66790/m.184560 type:complete len:224 (+) Transcript_66790:84-755(+)
MPQQEGYDHLYKLVLVGDATVGKTHLMARYIKGTLPKAPTATVGVEFATRTVQLAEGGTVKAQIWDTAGQERFRAITASHYRRAVGALLVYDITKMATFQNCAKWMEELRQNAEPDIVIMLVGNKVDLCEKTDAGGEGAPTGGSSTAREVFWDKAAEFARQHGLFFSEASAVTGYNVQHVFDHLLQEIYNHSSKCKSRDAGDEAGDGIHIGGARTAGQSKGCC